MKHFLPALLLALSPAIALSATLTLNPGTPTQCVLTPDTQTLLTVDTAGNATATGTMSGSCAAAPPPPDACANLAPLQTATPGVNWTRVIKPNNVKFGDNTVATNKDPTDYLSQWTYPGQTPFWPGSSGLTTRPTGAAKNMYFAEKFLVTAAAGRPNWAQSGSGINANASLTISVCPGDFGQTGTQLTTGCRTDISNSSGGLTSIVSATQVGGFCSLKPGGVYYLNFLPMANLPAVLTGAAISSCDASVCSPWFGVFN